MACQCDPGRHHGTGQRSGFLKGEVARQVYKRLLAQHRVLRQHPVEVGTKAVRQILGLIGPPNHRGWKHPAIRSPILTRVTPSPMTATSPAPSERGTTPSFVGPLFLLPIVHADGLCSTSSTVQDTRRV